MMTIIIMYSISVLLIVLGFIALLKQKTYIDADTKMPSEVDVPMLGKFKSNYPALIFVFFGFGLTVFAFNKPVGVDVWFVEGNFVKPTDKNVNWKNGETWVHPTNFIDPPVIEEDGTFEFEIQLEKGVSFEDAIQEIKFSFDTLGTTSIYPEVEYKNFKAGEKGCYFKKAGKYKRKYSAIKIDKYDEIK